MHDISDHKFNDGDSNIGGRLARKFLMKYQVKEDIIHDVVSIITTMSFKAGTNKVKQTTLEGKIVQDADY